MKGGLKTIVTALFVVLVAGLGVMLIFTVKERDKKYAEYEAKLVEKDATIEELETTVWELGATVSCYRLAIDAKSGTVAKEADFEIVEVHNSIADKFVQNIDEIVGQHYLLDYSAGTMFTKDMVYPVELEYDTRKLDIICDRTPIGFEVGDMVDVRITFPDGQDFLVMSRKLVNQVFGNVVRLEVNEKDILTYRAAESDWARFTRNGEAGIAVQIYCTIYVAGGQQEGISQYYPIPCTTPTGDYYGSVLWTAMVDLNMGDKDFADWMIEHRSHLELALRRYDAYWSLSDQYKQWQDLGGMSYNEKGELVIVEEPEKYSLNLEEGASFIATARAKREGVYAEAVSEYEEYIKSLEEGNKDESIVY